jgi:acetyl-CoA C-acetyltransferase
MRSESGSFAGRNMVSPAASEACADDVFAQAGIHDRRKEIDAVEMYVPFSWYEPMWLESLGFAEKGQGWKMVEEGATSIDGGDLPVNCSGGVLSSNPIGASGMIRFGEAALQVMGLAGDHQVDGAKTAVGHAYGGAAQYYAMWVVGAAK